MHACVKSYIHRLPRQTKDVQGHKDHLQISNLMATFAANNRRPLSLPHMHIYSLLTIIMYIFNTKTNFSDNNTMLPFSRCGFELISKKIKS